MKSTSVIALAAIVAALAPSAADSATVVVAKDCTQAERQAVNKLLEQDVNPFKACATKAKVDITTISTSRLCPIAECKTWLAYMAENAPNCVYDDTNYGVSFKAKAKDCGTDVGGSIAGDADVVTTKKPTTKSSTGSGADAGVAVPKPTTRAPLSAGSSSRGGSKGSDNDTTIEIPKTKKDNSTVIEPAPTRTPATKAPVTPAPTSSATPLNVASALCAVSLAVAALVV